MKLETPFGLFDGVDCAQRQRAFNKRASPEMAWAWATLGKSPLKENSTTESKARDPQVNTREKKYAQWQLVLTLHLQMAIMQGKIPKIPPFKNRPFFI